MFLPEVHCDDYHLQQNFHVRFMQAQTARLLTLENAQDYVLNAHIERLTKVQTVIYY